MEDINEVVRKNIYRIRKEKGLTQEGLAHEAGLHRAYIGQVERGEKKIGLTNLQKLSVAFEINITDFFERHDI